LSLTTAIAQDPLWCRFICHTPSLPLITREETNNRTKEDDHASKWGMAMPVVYPEDVV